MTGTNDDELRRRLTSLGADLTGLPGPSAARTRAAQRTRHQITTGVAAGVAVIALGGLGIVQVLGTTGGTMEPTQTPSDTATSDPAPTTAPSDAIPESASLTPGDIVDMHVTEWTQVDVDAVPSAQCAPALPDDVLASRTVVYEGPAMQPEPTGDTPDPYTNPTVRHDLLRVEPGTAARVADDLVAAMEQCVPNQADGTVDPPEWVDRFTVDNVGEQMNQSRYWAEPTFDDNFFATQVEYSVVAADDLVSVITRTGVTSEMHLAPDYLTPANAADRACLAVHAQTCLTGDPVPQGLGDYAASDPDAAPTGNSSSDLLPEALLAIEDIADDGSAWEDATSAELHCYDPGDLAGYGIDRSYQAPESGSEVAHHLYRDLPDGTGEAIIGSVEDCIGDRAVERTGITGVGDAMWSTVYTVDTTGDGEGDTIIHTSVMEYDSLTSVVVQAMQGQDWPEHFGAATAVNAADQACRAQLGETCVGDVGFEDLGPGDETGIAAEFLTDYQVSPIGNAGDFTGSAGDVTEVSENLRVNGCVDDAPDAEDWRQLWSNDLDATFTEIIFRFGSPADAAAFAQAHGTRSEGDCAVDTGDMFVVTNTAPEALEVGDAAYSWTVTHTPADNNPGASTSFFATGVAARGDVVVVLTFGAMSDPLDGEWTAYMRERLDLALDAAAG